MDGKLEPSPLALPRNGYPSICCLTSFSSQWKPSIRTSWDWQNLRHLSVPLVQGKLGKNFPGEWSGGTQNIRTLTKTQTVEQDNSIGVSSSSAPGRGGVLWRDGHFLIRYRQLHLMMQGLILSSSRKQISLMVWKKCSESYMNYRVWRNQSPCWKARKHGGEVEWLLSFPWCVNLNACFLVREAHAIQRKNCFVLCTSATTCLGSIKSNSSNLAGCRGRKCNITFDTFVFKLTSMWHSPQ